MPGQDCQVRMKLKVLFLILTLNMSLIMSAESFGIVVHGGAGVLSGLSIERQQEIENKVKAVSYTHLTLPTILLV